MARARAEANFRKEQRAKDGEKAMIEYHAQSRAIRDKTARLRALRLAKEAADKHELAPNKSHRTNFGRSRRPAEV
jgi:hypothetical protein